MATDPNDSAEAMAHQQLYEAALGEQEVADQLSPEPAPPPDHPAEQAVEQPPRQEEAPPPEQPQDGGIPSWRLREEAEARRAAEDQVRALNARLAQFEDWARRAQGAKQGPGNSADFFEDPVRAVQAIVQQMVSPYVNEDRAWKQEMAKRTAVKEHGAELVNEAERIFLLAEQQRLLDPMERQRVLGARNRWDAVVDWYQKAKSYYTVGNDPDAYFKKRLEEHMASPEFQAQMLERIRGSAASRPGTTQLPPTLSKVTASAGNGVDIGDLSHDSLYRAATRE